MRIITKTRKIPACLTTVCLLLGGALAGAAESNPPVTPEIIAAAERGDAAAQFQLACAYLGGKGVPKDVKKAYELMQAAADQGHADALNGLGYFHSAGVVVVKDEKKAAEWFRKGAEKGSAKACLNLGKWLLSGKAGSAESAEKTREEGLQWMKKSADQGLPEGALAYGSILFFGDHGMTTNYDQAAPYLKIAADTGNADAENLLGIMCEYGWGVPLDTVKAQEWFRKSALQGNPKAQSNLGYILGPLSEIKQTRIEALAWLLMASEQGEITATKELDDSVAGLKNGEMEAAKARMIELRKGIHKKSP